jgi:hypothetical protein
MPRLLEKPLQRQPHRRRIHLHGQMQRMRPLTPQQKTLALTTHPQTTPKKTVLHEKNPIQALPHLISPEGTPKTPPPTPQAKQ